jgi:transcriptional regulator of heat shock response
MVRGILDANSRRAQLVKVRNDLVPESEIDLSQYTNKMLNDLAEEGNKLQDELAQLDETGSSKLPYQEFQTKSKRLEEIGKILEEAQKKPEDFFPDDTAEIIKFPDDTDFAEGGIVSLT